MNAVWYPTDCGLSEDEFNDWEHSGANYHFFTEVDNVVPYEHRTAKGIVTEFDKLALVLRQKCFTKVDEDKFLPKSQAKGKRIMGGIRLRVNLRTTPQDAMLCHCHTTHGIAC